jgi:hypothetical protein
LTSGIPASSRICWAAVIAGLTQLDEEHWLVCGRRTDGRGFVAVYRPLDWQIDELESAACRAYLSCAAQRERQIAVKLRKEEAALAERERMLERSLADAERSAAEATARIEALKAGLENQEAELQQQESELADRHRSVAERGRELIRTRAVLRAPEEGLAAVESDWWEKQLGRPLSAKE